MNRAVLLLFAVVACAPELVAEESGPVQVRSWLDDVGKSGGALVIQTEFDPLGEVDLPTPSVEGLSFETIGEPVLERIGVHEVWTQRYRFRGDKGSYEIGQLEAVWHGPDEALRVESSPLFVDLSTDAPREGEISGIVEPSRLFEIPWAVIGAIGGAIALLFGGTLLAFRKPKVVKLAAVQAEAPDIVAIRQWEAVRRDEALDDHDKALNLSRIFREYTDVVLGFPASAWTTTETVNHLRGLSHLPEGNVPRARRLLRATDKVKFAEARPGQDFFDDLDADLRAFVGSTRPHRWDPKETP